MRWTATAVCLGLLLPLGASTSASAQATAQARVQAPARANEPHTHIKASRAAKPPVLDGRLTASNVQRDTVVYNDTWQDSTWDAVWQSAVSFDERGWSAEFRIPLSQLRFPAADQQTWGINVQRFVRRKNETTWLELVRKNE